MTNYFEPQTEQIKYLPESFDLLQFTGGVEDQGQTYNCVGNATVSLFEILLAEAGQPEDLSRLYPYFYGREEYPSLAGIDSGMFIADGLDATIEHGIPSEYVWEHDLAKINTEPSLSAQQDAMRHGLATYYTIDTVWNDEIALTKLAIARGYPVLTRFALSEQFATLGETEDYTGLNSGFDFAGYHALVAVGWDADSILYENSYGPQWGDGGFVEISNEVVQRDAKSMLVVTDFSSFGFTDDEAVINGLYLTILGRSADAGGLEYWDAAHDNGTIFRDIARAVYGSGEHKRTSNDDWLTDLYHDSLGREPDAAGYAYWESSALSAVEISGVFSASAEYVLGW